MAGAVGADAVSRFTRAHVVHALGVVLVAWALPSAGQAVPERLDGLVLDGRLEEWGERARGGIARTPSGRHLVLLARTESPILAQAEGTLAAVWTPEDPDREVRWDFPRRQGWGGPDPLVQSDIGLGVHPNVRSSSFELAFEVGALGRRLGVRPGDAVHVRLRDGERTLVDREIAWPSLPSPLPAQEIPERSTGALRIVAWNLESNALFEAERRPAIARVLAALDADLLVLQEVYDSTAAVAGRALDTLLPGALAWQARKATDVLIAARSELGRGLDLGYTDWGRALGTVWSAPGGPVVVVGVHLPCCTGGEPPADLRRAALLEGVATVARALPLDSAPGAPAPVRLVVGDFNLVGAADALAPLTEPRDGDLRFTVLDAPHLDGEETHTWLRAGGQFTPGRLDYALVDAASATRIERVFVLDDTDLNVETSGIRPGDVLRASDHLPIVVDLLPGPDGAPDHPHPRNAP